MSGSKEFAKTEAVGFVLKKPRYVDEQKWKEKVHILGSWRAQDVGPNSSLDYSFKLILRIESSDKRRG